MPSATLRREVARLRALVATRLAASPTPLLERLRRDPARLMAEAGLPPDDWQRALLQSRSPRMLLLCGRQAGKSSVAAALALKAALLEPCSPVLLLSPTLRQSGELFRGRLLPLYNALGRPVPGEATALELRLSNGSRIVSLPGQEATVRCYSGVRLVVLDEAARVPDDLYRAVRPMLAVSNGRLVALSTPFGKRGWFYDEWCGSGPWQRVKMPSSACPRIAPAFLAEEKAAIGARWYAQEYECSFEDVIGAVFSEEDIKAAMENGHRPLWGAEG